MLVEYILDIGIRIVRSLGAACGCTRIRAISLRRCEMLFIAQCRYLDYLRAGTALSSFRLFTNEEPLGRSCLSAVYLVYTRREGREYFPHRYIYTHVWNVWRELSRFVSRVSFRADARTMPARTDPPAVSAP